jgi:hypothetical protein
MDYANRACGMCVVGSRAKKFDHGNYDKYRINNKLHNISSVSVLSLLMITDALRHISVGSRVQIKINTIVDECQQLGLNRP